MCQKQEASDATVRREEFEALRVTMGRLRIDLDDALDRVRELEGKLPDTESWLREIEDGVQEAKDWAQDAFDEAHYAARGDSSTATHTVPGTVTP